MFVLGGANSSVCPAGYLPLNTAEACTSAAAVAGKAYGGSGMYSFNPAGCFWHMITGSVYYNANTTGVASSSARSLCAGAAARAHAPTHTQTITYIHAHAHAHRRAH